MQTLWRFTSAAKRKGTCINFRFFSSPVDTNFPIAMRAVVVREFGGPDQCQVAGDAPVPKRTAANQVLIKLHKAGLNPVDTYIRSGMYARKPQLPYVPCSDGAGEVLQVGSEVKNCKAGDRVYVARNPGGTCAEVCVSEEYLTFPLHPSLSYSQGASIGIPYCTALRAILHKSRLRPGQTVLVHGASGGVGLAAVQIARALGMKVLGTAGTPEGMDLVRSNGAHHVFCHRTDGYLTDIMSASDGAGVDAVLEMLANVNLQKDLEVLAHGGTIVVIGNRGTVEINPRDTMLKECSITGLILPAATKDEWEEYRAVLNAGMENGWLKPVVDKEYSMSQAGQAHKDIIENSGALGNIVINCLE